MFNIVIKETNNPKIIKFEFPDFITYGKNYEFTVPENAKDSPLSRKLLYRPFIKTVYISGNFIAIECDENTHWNDVAESVKEEIESFIRIGGKVLIDRNNPSANKTPISVYAESTPNPSVMKFVVNKRLLKTSVEYKSAADTASSPLAKAIFDFDYVKEVFIDDNYVSVHLLPNNDWTMYVTEIRSFIRSFIQNGGTPIIEELLPKETQEEVKDIEFEKLDSTSQQIVNIIEEFVKPAVAGDGGNIVFKNYDAETKKVTVIMQGACSGCPSSRVTLKNGIENILKDKLFDNEITVEAAK